MGGAQCRFLVLFECIGVFLFAYVAGHALVMLFQPMCKEMHPVEDGEGLSVSLAIFTFTVSFFAEMYTVVKVYLEATEETCSNFLLSRRQGALPRTTRSTSPSRSWVERARLTSPSRFSQNWVGITLA